MSNIYRKYCSSIQNHALGAYTIASFINGYKSVKSEFPNLLHIFIFLPMIMNEDIRNSIKAPKGNGGITRIETFISNKIYDKNNTFSTLHNIISCYKEYTLTCLIFGLKTGLITLSEDSKIPRYQLSSLLRNITKKITFF